MNAKSVVIIVALAALLAACSGGNATQPSPTQAPAAAKQEAPKPTEAAKPAATTQPAAAAKPTDAPRPAAAKPTEPAADAVQLGELNRGLDKLASFRMVWALAWEGKDSAGKPSSGKWDMLQEYITASKDQHLKWITTESDPSKTGAMEIFSVGDTTYMLMTDASAKTAEPNCVAVSSEDNKQSASVVEPWTFFGDLRDAKLVKKGERVNGILTDQYLVDAKSAGFGTFTSGQGDVWVAQDGGFVVRYAGKYEGKGALLLGNMAEGAMTWNYELKDIGQVGAITPPKSCAPPGAGVPIPPGAKDKSSIMGMTSFKTADPVKAVLDFYKKELGALGYKAGAENAFGTMTQIEFAKDSEKLSLMISQEQGETTVILNLSK